MAELTPEEKLQQEQQDKLRNALVSLRELKFKFENDGTKIIYVGDEYLER